MEETEIVVTDFLQKLTDSGYNQTKRTEILKSGCKNFCRRMIEDRTGGRPLYRTDLQMKEARRIKKLKNQHWFKAARGGKDLTPKKDLPFNEQEAELNMRKKGRKHLKVNIEIEGEKRRKQRKKRIT